MRAVDNHDYFLLRAEWLRFRNHLFDSGTDIPTLSAVLDDARRLLEERGSLGLVYLDLADTGRLESQHGFQVYDELLGRLGGILEGLRGSLLGRRDIVALLAVRSDKFLLFVEGHRESPLNAAAMAARAAALRGAIARELTVATEGLPLGSVRFFLGYALLRRDPMLRAERSVQRALDEAMRMCLAERNHADGQSAAGLDAIIEEQRLTTLFQPIMSLDDLTVLGHEVFTRGPRGGVFEDPDRLFALAERTGRLVALERLCRQRAFSSLGSHLPAEGKLFLNTTAHALRDPEVGSSAFVDQISQAGLQPRQVVLEITERAAVEERRSYLDVLRRLKSLGVGIAIDDMGAGYSSLQAIVDLEPNYLKFDIALVRNIDRSQIKRSLLETVVELSTKIGAAVIAEGIEAESELATVRRLGVGLGQGRFLAAPTAVRKEAGQ